MADITFACPLCSQMMTCDDAWCDQQIQCPTCQGIITAPPKPAQPGGRGAHSPLVPKPPAHGTKLSLGAAQTPGAEISNQGPRTIPIRNLAPPPRKKESPVAKIAVTAAILVALGAGAYFGWPYLRDLQDKANAKRREAEKSSDGGQVGHIAELHGVLDATEPDKIGRLPSGGATGPKKRQGAQEIPIPADGATPDAAAPKSGPVAKPVYTLEMAAAKIPNADAGGKVAGTNFVPETIRIDPLGTFQALRFTEGSTTAPDRELLVYLRLKAGDKIAGQKINVSKEMKGATVPQIIKRWKTSPLQPAPLMRTFTSGYVMKLELGQPADGNIPGKIYLALPDKEESVVAGNFKAASSIPETVPEGVVSPAPTQSPPPGGMTPGQRGEFERRYGIAPPQ